MGELYDVPEAKSTEHPVPVVIIYYFVFILLYLHDYIDVS